MVLGTSQRGDGDMEGWVVMNDIKQAVQAQFGPVAAAYRTSAVHAAGEDLALIAEAVARYPQPLVLDVGCGAGHVSRSVAPVSREVVAFDLTEAMLEQVTALMSEHGITNVRTQQGDVERLPFPDASFDLVLSRLSAHHWPDPTRAVAECLRVLRPGGALLISDIVAPEAPADDSFLQTVEVLRDHSHVRDYRVSEWQELFATLGVSASVTATWEVPIDFQSWVARMATPPERVAVLRDMLTTCSLERRAAFVVQADGSFTLQGALFTTLRSGR
jgi:ubiquinone/menaquinone biosynthesis C-methylase UbiE